MGEPGLFLNGLDYMRLTCGALAVCETATMGLETCQMLDTTKETPSFTWFLSDHPAGLLYSALQNVYPSLIVEMATRLTKVTNRKLHTTAVRELLRRFPTFELPLTLEAKNSFPCFRKPLRPNFSKVVTDNLETLLAPEPRRFLSPTYHTPAQTANFEAGMAAAMPALLQSAQEKESAHLRRHANALADDLEPLDTNFLGQHDLTSIATVIRSIEEARPLGEQFLNETPIGQAHMVFGILEEEETRLHAMIRAAYERKDSVSELRKSLQAKEQKLERVLQMLKKVQADLLTEEVAVEKSENNTARLNNEVKDMIARLDKKVPDTCLPNLSGTSPSEKTTKPIATNTSPPATATPK